MIIREIHKTDLPVCIALGHEMWQESDFRNLSYSWAKCYSLGEYAIDKPEYLWIVAVQDGEIQGMLGASIQETFFGHDRTTTDFLVYVHPDARGGMAFYRMIKYYVKWAKDMGAKAWYLSNSTNINPEMTGKLFERLGLKKIGGIYKGE